jgi:hypothetical protein
MNFHLLFVYSLTVIFYVHFVVLPSCLRLLYSFLSDVTMSSPPFLSVVCLYLLPCACFSDVDFLPLFSFFRLFCSFLQYLIVSSISIL